MTLQLVLGYKLRKKYDKISEFIVNIYRKVDKKADEKLLKIALQLLF